MQQLREQIWLDNHPQVYEIALVPEWLAVIKQAVFGDFIYFEKIPKKVMCFNM